jgi:hypothetical protein
VRDFWIVVALVSFGFLFSLTLMSTFEDIRHRPPCGDIDETPREIPHEEHADAESSLRGESLRGDAPQEAQPSLEELTRYVLAFARLDERAQFLIDGAARKVSYQELADELKASRTDPESFVTREKVAELILDARKKLFDLMRD